MYEDIYSAYHVGLKPPVLSAKEVKRALKELKGFKVQKSERKAAIRYALSFNQKGGK